MNAPAPAKPKFHTREQLLAMLATQTEPVERGAGYHASVFVVAMLLLFLPVMLFFVLVIVLLAVNIAASSVGPHAVPFALMVDGAVGLVAFFVLIAIFKPIFAGRSRPQAPFSVDRQQEPFLFEYVERLCYCVGAPTPSRIDVNTDVNASASFGNGIFCLLGGGDLVLTIGLPLAAAMPLQQLTGVMAHEFGHFRQGSAMRLTFAIGTINAWLDRVVQGRDAWDIKLEEAAENGNAFAGLAIRFFNVTRYALWSYMKLSHALSCQLSRQMEFDADQYEGRVSGSAAFRKTSLNMYALEWASDMAFRDLGVSWRESRLSDDLPAMIVARVAEIPKRPKTAAKVKQSIMESKAEWFHTHPSTKDRIERIEAHNFPGLLHTQTPATALFNNFPGLCKAATLAFYQEAIDEKIDNANLATTEEVVQEQDENRNATKTLNRYFQGRIIGFHEIFLPIMQITKPNDPKKALNYMREMRERMIKTFDHTAAVVYACEQADTRVVDLVFAKMILDSGFRIDPVSIGVAASTPEAIESSLKQARVKQKEQHDRLAQIATVAKNRMVLALQLLAIPKVYNHIENGAALRGRVDNLLTTLSWLERVWPALDQLDLVCVELDALLRNWNRDTANPMMHAQIERRIAHVSRMLIKVKSELGDMKYPFRHAIEGITISDYALKAIPPTDDIRGMFEAAGDLRNQLFSLYYRVFAFLAVTSEKVEESFGMEPLEDVHDPLSDVED